MNPDRQDDAEDDRQLEALRDLPTLRMEASAGARVEKAARAAFVETFDDSPWHSRLARDASRAIVPLVVVSVGGVYLAWAINTASALVR